jgi:glycosyltransferase involved in cell wall biosynthesis
VAVTGANPPPDLLDLEGPNLVFQGHVGDLKEMYDCTRVAISPIRFGAGVKLKTVQALQHGVPVVSTSYNAEGIATCGLDAIAIADTPHEFAKALVSLLASKAQWERRRAAVRQLLEQWHRDPESHDWPSVISESLARRHSWR